MGGRFIDFGNKCRNTWTELKPDGVRPKARYAHSLTSCNGRVYLFGGESNTCECLLSVCACLVTCRAVLFDGIPDRTLPGLVWLDA